MHRALAITLAVACCGQAASQDGLELADKATDDHVVLTPTRLRQALRDVPASVTVIRAETLQRYGVRNIVDALRLVPGMQITEPSGPDIRINYHGTNVLSPRRMNVLIDGVSAYQPAFSRIDWKNLPVQVQDIDRIEVTRGSNSATYGPNSMTAIVNIITKHPQDTPGALVETTVGSLRTVGVTARYGASFGPTAFRISAGREHDSGYTSLSRADDGHDSTTLSRLNIRSVTQLGTDTVFTAHAGYVGGTKQVASTGDDFRLTYPDIRSTDYFLDGTLTTRFSPQHELKLQANLWRNDIRQRWTSCPPTALLLPEMYDLWRANPSYALAVAARQLPTGGTPRDDALAATARTAIARLGTRATQPTCSTANQDLTQDRLDVELQDTYVWSDALRFVSGIGARRNHANTQTFLAGSVSDVLWRAFGSVEFRPADALTINAGGYYEHARLSGSSFSPRVAANVHLSPNQTVRFVWSTGTRSPDIQEQRADWSYRSSDASPTLNGSSDARFFQSAVSPGHLRSERMTSREIGYLLNVPAYGLLLDAKAFDDRLTDLISEKLQLSSFLPTNGNSVRLSGAEVQIDLELSPHWHAFGRYAYLRHHEATTPLERSQYSRHSGSVGVSHRFSDGWRWSFAHYGSSGDGIGERSYGRQDLTVARDFHLGTSRVSATLQLRRLDNKASSYYRDVGDYPVSGQARRLQLFGQFLVGF